MISNRLSLLLLPCDKSKLTYIVKEFWRIHYLLFLFAEFMRIIAASCFLVLWEVQRFSAHERRSVLLKRSLLPNLVNGISLALVAL